MDDPNGMRSLFGFPFPEPMGLSQGEEIRVEALANSVDLVTSGEAEADWTIETILETAKKFEAYIRGELVR